ncbi:hypothetical protein PCE1_004436 [Barthelona sp. PCE]
MVKKTYILALVLLLCVITPKAFAIIRPTPTHTFDPNNIDEIPCSNLPMEYMVCTPDCPKKATFWDNIPLGNASCTIHQDLPCSGPQTFTVENYPCFETNDHHFPTVHLLSVFGGFLGLDRFYVGHTFRGVLKLITLGGFGVWWFFDMILAASGNICPDAGSNRCKTMTPNGAEDLLIMSSMDSHCFLTKSTSNTIDDISDSEGEPNTYLATACWPEIYIHDISQPNCPLLFKFPIVLDFEEGFDWGDVNIVGSGDRIVISHKITPDELLLSGYQLDLDKKSAFRVFSISFGKYDDTHNFAMSYSTVVYGIGRKLYTVGFNENPVVQPLRTIPFTDECSLSITSENFLIIFGLGKDTLIYDLNKLTPIVYLSKMLVNPLNIVTSQMFVQSIEDRTKLKWIDFSSQGCDQYNVTFESDQDKELYLRFLREKYEMFTDSNAFYIKDHRFVFKEKIGFTVVVEATRIESFDESEKYFDSKWNSPDCSVGYEISSANGKENAVLCY